MTIEMLIKQTGEKMAKDIVKDLLNAPYNVLSITDHQVYLKKLHGDGFRLTKSETYDLCRQIGRF